MFARAIRWVHRLPATSALLREESGGAGDVQHALDEHKRLALTHLLTCPASKSQGGVIVPSQPEGCARRPRRPLTSC